MCNGNGFECKSKELISRETAESLANSVTKLANNMTMDPKIMSGINEQLKSISETARAVVQSDAVKAMGEALAGISSYISKIQPIAPLDLSKLFSNIEISDEFKDAVNKYRFIMICSETSWPLYFFDENIRDTIIKDKAKQNEESIREIAIAYFEENDAESFLDYWKESKIINNEHLEPLREAITLFKKGYYYGCVSICSCTILGIIDEIYKYASKEGVEFSKDTLSYFYEHINSEKPTKSIINEIKKSQRLDSGKKQMLYIATVMERGLLLRREILSYIYSTILSSDPDAIELNQPCRNKICHGLKNDYGNIEIAIKAIIAIDLVYRMGEALYIDLLDKCKVEKGRGNDKR